MSDMGAFEEFLKDPEFAAGVEARRKIIRAALDSGELQIVVEQVQFEPITPENREA